MTSSHPNKKDLPQQDNNTAAKSSRRKFITRAGAVAPVLMLSSRSALAATCNISGFQSVNPSGLARHYVDGCGGFSPGAWKTPDGGNGQGTGGGNGQGNGQGGGSQGDGNRAQWWQAGCTPNPRPPWDIETPISTDAETATELLTDENGDVEVEGVLITEGTLSQNGGSITIPISTSSSEAITDINNFNILTGKITETATVTVNKLVTFDSLDANGSQDPITTYLVRTITTSSITKVQSDVAGTAFSSVFNQSSKLGTLHDALLDGGDQLSRHAAASYLNSVFFGWGSGINANKIHPFDVIGLYHAITSGDASYTTVVSGTVINLQGVSENDVKNFFEQTYH